MPQYTQKEMEDRFIGLCKAYVKYWTKNQMETTEETLLGFLHSILVIFDGGTGLPALKIFPDPHPEDKEYHIEQGEKWWPPFPEDLEERNDICQLNISSLHDRVYEKEE